MKHQKTVVQPKIILQDNDEESVAERQKAINEMKRKKEIEKRDREIKERQKRETSVHKQGLINRNVAVQTDGDPKFDKKFTEPMNAKQFAEEFIYQNTNKSMEHSGIEQKMMSDDLPPSAAVAVWAARYAH